MKKKILVTGGAGYIGSHMVRMLAKTRSYQPIVFDNLATGANVPVEVPFYRGDLRNKGEIEVVFKLHDIHAVMHFAASTDAADSVNYGFPYYENNVVSSVNLVNAMEDTWCDKLVFSSTAAVYGWVDGKRVKEDAETNPINPYGKSKLFVESMLKDSPLVLSVVLRYFNVGGYCHAHPAKSHLISNILRACDESTKVMVFGDDYPTPDGTGVRDFVHVEDICRGHLLALKRLESGKGGTFNLGSGCGYSVKQVIDEARKITKRNIFTETCPRRKGDPACVVADCRRARKVLGWKPLHDLRSIIKSSWKYQK